MQSLPASKLQGLGAQFRDLGKGDTRIIPQFLDENIVHPRVNGFLAHVPVATV